LSEQAIVDPTKIAFWSMSFSESFAACAAALDKRAKCLIMVCPFVEFYTNDQRRKVFAEAKAEKHCKPKEMLPSLSFHSPPTATMRQAWLPAELEAYKFMTNVEERGANNFEKSEDDSELL
jgi:hypothetical protein